MRTTICITDQLLREAKLLAARTGRSLTSIVEEALCELLSRHQSPARGEPARLVTHGGKGPLPGVNLDNSAALLQVMECSGAPQANGQLSSARTASTLEPAPPAPVPARCTA